MKSSTQPIKSLSSSTNFKSKKSSKDREKRKSQTGLSENNHLSNEKGSPIKDARQYAGISSETICTYAEQCSYEHLSEEICDTLSEDINYKLRYIIHDAQLKARLSGRNLINCSDIEETFANLSISKVYGAPESPNWVPFGDQNLLYIDDTRINLVELAEEENMYSQPGDAIITTKWVPDMNDVTKPLKNYFTTMCQSLVGNDEDIRIMALQDISENSYIGPIMEWFYNFGFLLLSKDITYDCLTLSALQLIDTLENSPLSSISASGKQLELLVRLILQRLLKSITTEEVLRPMCSVLAILCLRVPLRELVIVKINQKMYSICEDFALSILTIINYLGIEGIMKIFIPHMNYFLNRTIEREEPDLIYALLGLYCTVCRTNLDNLMVHNNFYDVFGMKLVMFWRLSAFKVKAIEKPEINFVNMKKQLIKTRRKVDCNIRRGSGKIQLEEVFEIPTHNCRVRKKIEELRLDSKSSRKQTRVVVGKTSLLLSVLKTNKNRFVSNCCDHTLVSYNL